MRRCPVAVGGPITLPITSGTIPTTCTSRWESLPRPTRRDRPIGSASGQRAAAAVLLRIAISALPDASSGVKLRPRDMGILKIWKYSGETLMKFATDALLESTAVAHVTGSPPPLIGIALALP